jgi:hypothetical protein
MRVTRRHAVWVIPGLLASHAKRVTAIHPARAQAIRATHSTTVVGHPGRYAGVGRAPHQTRRSRRAAAEGDRPGSDGRARAKIQTREMLAPETHWGPKPGHGPSGRRARANPDRSAPRPACRCLTASRPRGLRGSAFPSSGTRPSAQLVPRETRWPRTIAPTSTVIACRWRRQPDRGVAGTAGYLISIRLVTSVTPGRLATSSRAATLSDRSLT